MLMHERERDITPASHVTEQVPHGLHADHVPMAEKQKRRQANNPLNNAEQKKDVFTARACFFPVTHNA